MTAQENERLRKVQIEMAKLSQLVESNLSQVHALLNKHDAQLDVMRLQVGGLQIMSDQRKWFLRSVAGAAFLALFGAVVHRLGF